MRRVVHFLLAAIAIILSTLAIATPAHAMSTEPTPIGPQESESNNYPGCQAAELNEEARADALQRASIYLPIERWSSGAGQFHSRLDSSVWGDLNKKLSRDFTAQMFGFGNMLYGLGTSLVGFAVRFDVLCEIARDADSSAATLANGLTSIIGGVVGLGLLVVVFRQYKNQSNSFFPYIAKTTILIAVFVILFNGATNGASGGDPRGSPGWAAITVNDVIMQLGTLPAEALINEGGGALNRLTNELESGAPESWHCDSYTNWLKDQYRTRTSKNWEATIPLALSSLWESTGKAAWEDAQFGQDNLIGERVGCRLLDHLSRVPVGEARGGCTPDGGDTHSRGLKTIGRFTDLTCSIGSSPGANFFVLPELVSVDRWIIAWAACDYSGGGGFSISPEFQAVISGGEKDTFNNEGIAAEDCARWWQRSSDDAFQEGGGLPEGFNYIDDPTRNARELSTAPEAHNFIENLHGDVAGSPAVLAGAYVFAAFLIMLAFGALALSLIISKIVVIALIPLVFLFIVFSLWPSRSGAGDKLTKFAKYFLGAISFTLLFVFILSLVAILTTYIAEAGIEVAGEGSYIASIWTGLSPIIAFFIVHLLFKTVGLPSPISPTGALGYATVMAGTGGAVAAGVGSALSRVSTYGRAGAGKWMAKTSPAARAARIEEGRARAGMGAGPGNPGSPGPGGGSSGGGGPSGNNSGGGRSGGGGPSGARSGGGTGSLRDGSSDPASSKNDGQNDSPSGNEQDDQIKPNKKKGFIRRTISKAWETTKRGVKASPKWFARPFMWNNPDPKANKKVGRRVGAMVMAGAGIAAAVGSFPLSATAIAGAYVGSRIAGRAGMRLFVRPTVDSTLGKAAFIMQRRKFVKNQTASSVIDRSNPNDIHSPTAHQSTQKPSVGGRTRSSNLNTPNIGTGGIPDQPPGRANSGKTQGRSTSSTTSVSDIQQQLNARKVLDEVKKIREELNEDRRNRDS